MAWTNVPKPSSTTYTTVTFTGTREYDDAFVLYDSAVPYDDVNPGAWTNVAKPAQTILTGGGATGLIMPPTRLQTGGKDTWTYVHKPS